MTQPASETGAVAALRARGALIRAVREQLRGSGLEIRERASELVISHPGRPDHGRIYITYTSGDVSHRRTSWEYLGHLDGHGRNPDAEPSVKAAAIIGALGGRAVTPS